MAILVLDPYVENQILAARIGSDGDQYDEVWEGVYIVTPLPNDEHQEIVSALNAILDQVVARVKSSLQRPRKWSLNWFMPAGVNSTEGSQRGTSTSLGRRVQPFDSKKARYFSRSSSVFMVLRRL